MYAEQLAMDSYLYELISCTMYNVYTCNMIYKILLRSKLKLNLFEFSQYNVL